MLISFIMYKRRRGVQNNENIFVAVTIVLCFLVTFGLAFAFSGRGFLDLAGVFAKSEERTFYMLAIGGYDDMTFARNTAELVKDRGGAGYVVTDGTNGIEIIIAVYEDRSSAEAVLNTIEDRSAYLKEVAVKKSDFDWCEGELKTAVKDAMTYFDLAFDSLYETSNSLNDNAISLEQAETQKKVLSARIEDLKSNFYSKTGGEGGEQVTEIKLALITTSALLDNIKFDSVSKACSSIRYQLVQLVYCYAALMKSI